MQFRRFSFVPASALLIALGAFLPDSPAFALPEPGPKLPKGTKAEKDCEDEDGKDACLLCCAKKARGNFKDCLDELGSDAIGYCISEANLFQSACNQNCDD